MAAALLTIAIIAAFAAFGYAIYAFTHIDAA
jgi:hypothetical protein